MRKWYITVETSDGPKTSFFYYSDKNPFKKYPNRFGFPIDNGEEYGNVTRDMVDGLNENKEYYALDVYDDLGQYFPKVPDVPPSEGRPTYFVAIPKSKVLNVDSE